MLYEKFKHKQINNCTLINDNCLDVMDDMIENGIKVDAVICDPPFGITACHFDKQIYLKEMWAKIKDLIKYNTPIVLFGSQPFTTKLISSNLKMFKYCLIWEKEQGSMPMNAPYQPIKVHEDIVVFSNAASTYSKKGNMTYNPQKTIGNPYKASQRKTGNMTFHTDPSGDHFKDNKGDRYPRSVLRFKTERGYHPNQKPTHLLEYLIKTYTNEGELILDFTAGSFSTCVAAENTNRRSIGIELEEKYYNIGIERLKCCMKG